MVRAVLSSGCFTQGLAGGRFEEELAEVTGAGCAVAVSG